MMWSDLPNRIYTFCMVFFIMVLLPLILIPFLIICILLLRPGVWVLQKIFRPDLDTFVAHGESLYAADLNRASINIMTTVIVQGDMTVERQIQQCQDRVLNFKNQEGEFIYSKLRSTWTNYLGFAFWKTDPDFDLRHHIREYDYTGEMALPESPGICTEKDLHRVLGGLLEAPWDRHRSPWESLLIRNFGPERNQLVLIIRFDHVLGDGYSLTNCTKRLIQSCFALPKFRNYELDLKQLSWWRRAGLVMKFPYDTAANLWLLYDEEAKLRHYHPRNFSRGEFFRDEENDGETVIVSVSPAMDTSVLKKIKNHFRVSFAAVLYAGILGAIERAMVASGMEVPERLVSSVVVPKPDHPEGLCVHASVLAGEWPMKDHGPVERLLKIQKSFRSLNLSSAAVAYSLMIEMGSYLPTSVRFSLFKLSFSLGFTLGITVFPVPSEPDYYEGQEILDLISGTSTSLYALGLLVTTAGVNNKQRLQFSVKKSVFATPQITRNLGLYAEQEILALLEATKVERRTEL